MTDQAAYLDTLPAPTEPAGAPSEEPAILDQYCAALGMTRFEARQAGLTPELCLMAHVMGVLPDVSNRQLALLLADADAMASGAVPPAPMHYIPRPRTGPYAKRLVDFIHEHDCDCTSATVISGNRIECWSEVYDVRTGEFVADRQVIPARLSAVKAYLGY